MGAAADWTPWVRDWSLGLWVRVEWQQVFVLGDWDEVRCVHRSKCCWFHTDVWYLREPDYLRHRIWEHERHCGGTGADPTNSGILNG